jgi:hypothetical protein
MAVESHRVVIRDLNSDVPLDEIPAKNLQYSFNLNAPGSVGFVLPTRHPKCTKDLLDPGRREIIVYKGDTKRWGGYLWTAQVEEGAETVRFSGEGWPSRLRRRYVDNDKIYTASDQFDIAWDLINFTQTQTDGNLGITRFSTVLSGVSRDRTYLAIERKKIGEALEQLAAVRNGFDFEITPDKEWKTYYPFKQTGLIPIFEYGKNLRSYGYVLDASQLSSEITALGQSIVSVATDVAARAKFSLLEDTRSFSSVINQDVLAGHAQEELRLAKIQQEQLQLQIITDDPPIAGYSVGDMARIRISHGYVNLDTMKRITAINIQVSDEGNESIGVFFGEEGQAGSGEGEGGITTTIRQGNDLTTDSGSPTSEGTNKRLDAIEGAAWTGRTPDLSLVTVTVFYWISFTSREEGITFKLRVRKTSGTPADITNDSRTYRFINLTPGYAAIPVQFASDGVSTYSYIAEVTNLVGPLAKSILVDYIKEEVTT